MAGAMTMITEETVVEMENGAHLNTNKCYKDFHRVILGPFFVSENVFLKNYRAALQVATFLCKNFKTQ